MIRMQHVRIAASAIACHLAAVASAQDMHSMAGMQGMKMAPNPVGVSMARLASGTTWTPDAVVLPARAKMIGDWDLMLHGFAFAQYIAQSGERGKDQFGSLNWAMVMATRELFGGRFQARTMLSADPATIADGGYPLLLQSGESYKGQPIRDRQHPHDAFMELALMYERELTKRLGFSAYVAPAGEPALGPVAFMHRPSAMDNPFAPLGHHWQDATHITFGVATAGLFGNRWKLEASTFNAREPDDQRWNFDIRAPRSLSARLTVNPDSHWSVTAGYGVLDGAEAAHPDDATRRMSVSALHGRAIGMTGQWSTAFVWGSNAAHGELSHAMLIESEAVFSDKHTLLGRAELVQKSGEDLGLSAPIPPDEHFNVLALSVGYIREIVRGRGATLGGGVVGSVNLIPAALTPDYGTRSPLGIAVFLRVRPSFTPRHAMHDMGPMEGMRHGR